MVENQVISKGTHLVTSDGSSVSIAGTRRRRVYILFRRCWPAFRNEKY